jgi:hypothetical protein
MKLYFVLVLLVILLLITLKFKTIRENFETIIKHQDLSDNRESLNNLGDENKILSVDEFNSYANNKNILHGDIQTRDFLNNNSSEFISSNGEITKEDNIHHIWAKSSKKKKLPMSQSSKYIIDTILYSVVTKDDLVKVSTDLNNKLNQLITSYQNDYNDMKNNNTILLKFENDLTRSINVLNTLIDENRIYTNADGSENIDDAVISALIVKKFVEKIKNSIMNNDDSAVINLKALKDNILEDNSEFRKNLKQSLDEYFKTSAVFMTKKSIDTKTKKTEYLNNIKTEIDNKIDSIIRDDPLLNSLNTNNNIFKENDLVFFRHTLTENNLDYGVSGENMDLIIGGTICSIVGNDAILRYNVIYNPNINSKSRSSYSNGTRINNSTPVNIFDNSVNGLPKWYNYNNDNKDCIKNLPTLDNKWITEYLGNGDCGVSPTKLKLPDKIKLNLLSKSVSALLNDTPTKFNMFYVPINDIKDAGNSSKFFTTNQNNDYNVVINFKRGFTLNVRLIQGDIYKHIDNSSFKISPESIKFLFISRLNNKLYALLNSRDPIWYTMSIVGNKNDNDTTSLYVENIKSPSDNDTYYFKWTQLIDYINMLSIEKIEDDEDSIDNLVFYKNSLCLLDSAQGVPGSIKNLNLSC